MVCSDYYLPSVSMWLILNTITSLLIRGCADLYKHCTFLILVWFFLPVRNLAFEQECEDFLFPFFKKFLTNSASAWNLKNLSSKRNENKGKLYSPKLWHFPFIFDSVHLQMLLRWTLYWCPDNLLLKLSNCLLLNIWTVEAWLRYLDYNRPRRWMLE